MARRRWVIALAVAGLIGVAAWLLLSAGASGGSSGVVGPPGPPLNATGASTLRAGSNLLLVTIDTLRADHLRVYGYAAVETPNLDRLAAEGIRVEHAVSPVPITLPAHASLMTGLYPYRHQVRDNHAFVLDEEALTLAEVLGGAAYETGGFIAAFVLDDQFGIAQGFDHYTQFEVSGRTFSTDPRVLGVERRAQTVADEARAWILDRTGDWFAWVHFYDPHLPYDAPEPFRSRYADRPYDGEIAYVDRVLGDLLGALRAAGRLDDTLVIVAGDHGEGLGDHGESEHGYFVYDSTVRVPLIFWVREGLPRGVVVPGPVSLVDVLPTALGLLGVDDAEGTTRDGIDVRPLLADADAVGRPVYAESLIPRLDFGWSDLRSLSAPDHKFILAPRAELYDLRADPGETDNVVDRLPRRAAGLRAALEDPLAAHDAQARGGDAPAPVADAETVERLLSLGYIGGNRAAPRPDVDPKDKVELYEAYAAGIRRAARALLDNRWADAIDDLSRLDGLADHYWVKYQLGRARLASGDTAAAIDELERSLELNPTYALTWVELARAQRASGHPERGIDLLRDGARAFPDVALFPLHLGFHLYQDGALEEALQAYLAARRLAPDDPALLNNLAHLYVVLDRPEAARSVLRSWTAATPDDATAWEALGVLLARSEDWTEAEAALRRATELAPDAVEARYRLGLVLLQLGRPADAAAAFRSVLAIDPGHAAAREALGRLQR